MNSATLTGILAVKHFLKLSLSLKAAILKGKTLERAE